MVLGRSGLCVEELNVEGFDSEGFVMMGLGAETLGTKAGIVAGAFLISTMKRLQYYFFPEYNAPKP